MEMEEEKEIILKVLGDSVRKVCIIVCVCIYKCNYINRILMIKVLMGIIGTLLLLYLLWNLKVILIPTL